MSKCLSIALIALLSAFSLKAQEDISGLIRESLSGWPALANNVSITTATQRSLDQRKIISGTVTAFGHSVGVEGRLVRAQGKNHLERLALIFPEATQLNRQHISQLAGEDMLAGVPEGLNANLKLDRLELDFFRKKVTAARVRVSANTWALIAGEDLKITSIQAAIAILDPTSSAQNLSISLTGSLLLPDSVASYFGLGATALTAHGYLDTKQRQMSLYAEISSEKIPIGKQDVLFLRNAFIELYSRQQEVGIALGGQLELNMPGQSPILLNGEVSIDLKAAIFGQAWMTGVWRNPFGISDQLYITNLGLGFGVDFSKLPYPLPIVAVEGGLSVGSPDPKKARFGGKVTLGLHAGNPSKNMLDARNINANLYDIISAFYAPGVPKDLAQTFKGIQLKNGRLTIVPPGDGVSLFGNRTSSLNYPLTALTSTFAMRTRQPTHVGGPQRKPPRCRQARGARGKPATQRCHPGQGWGWPFGMKSPRHRNCQRLSGLALCGAKWARRAARRRLGQRGQCQCGDYRRLDTHDPGRLPRTQRSVRPINRRRCEFECKVRQENSEPLGKKAGLQGAWKAHQAGRIVG